MLNKSEEKRQQHEFYDWIFHYEKTDVSKGLFWQFNLLLNIWMEKRKDKSKQARKVDAEKYLNQLNI